MLCRYLSVAVHRDLPVLLSFACSASYVLFPIRPILSGPKTLQAGILESQLQQSQECRVSASYA